MEGQFADVAFCQKPDLVGGNGKLKAVAAFKLKRCIVSVRICRMYVVVVAVVMSVGVGSFCDYRSIDGKSRRFVVH